MRVQFEKLLAASKKVPNPSEQLIHAIKEAEKVLSNAVKSTEFIKLSKALDKENPNATIAFREDEAGLFVYTEFPGLLYKLAVILGCPPNEAPAMRDAEFEARENWHGKGAVNLRKLADEISLTDGEFFCVQLSIKDIHHRAGQ